MKYIIQLRRGYFYTEDYNGSETTVYEFAKRFDRIGDAYICLGELMNKSTSRKFRGAKVIEVEI